MTASLRDGKSLAWHMYPSYPWGGAKRKRTYSHLSTPGRDQDSLLVGEDGFSVNVENNAMIYDALKHYARSAGRVIYTPKIDLGPGRNTIVRRAVEDKDAEVSYHPKGGIRGIKFKHKARNSRAGAILLESTWPKETSDPFSWLSNIRRMSELVGVGDFDTAGQFGQATLSRFWTEHRLKKIWRLPEDLTGSLNYYSVGGRAEFRGASSALYPNAVNLDLSSAYPTAVARGLPVGNPMYHGRDYKFVEREAVYGVWKITVHEDIPFSPIPVRNWENKGGPIGWSLDSGWEFEYGAWDDEITALIATGRASAEFIRGWSWERLSTMLAPWVDEMVDLRRKSESLNDTDVAVLVKLITNAAIGRWGMSNEHWEVVVDQNSNIEYGDLPIEFPREASSDYFTGFLTGLWVRPVTSEKGVTLPYHWSSYVKMVVRMELYRKCMEEMSRGGIILGMNFDSILMAARPQGSNEMDVWVEQSKRPWNWKVEQVANVQMPYNRGYVFEMTDGTVKAKLPGASGEARKKIVSRFTKESSS